MNYTVLSGNSTYALAELVESYLRLGWRLHGGVSVAMTAVHTKYAQAVVRN